MGRGPSNLACELGVEPVEVLRGERVQPDGADGGHDVQAGVGLVAEPRLGPDLVPAKLQPLGEPVPDSWSLASPPALLLGSVSLLRCASSWVAPYTLSRRPSTKIRISQRLPRWRAVPVPCRWRLLIRSNTRLSAAGSGGWPSWATQPAVTEARSDAQRRPSTPAERISPAGVPSGQGSGSRRPASGRSGAR